MDIDTLYKFALSGDTAAKNKLFDHLTKAFSLLAEHKVQDVNDAQDLVQEVLIIIAEKYQHVEIQTNYSAWAYGVFENRLKRYYRDKKRKKRLNKEYLDMNTQSSIKPINYELRHRIIKCLRKLNQTNSRYTEVLNLHHRGYNTKEISKEMGITKKAVYNIMFRARSLLKICINEGKD